MKNLAKMTSVKSRFLMAPYEKKFLDLVRDPSIIMK